MTVSSFKIACDFPDCKVTIIHGAVRPPLLVAEFSEGVGQLLVAHRWTIDDKGRDMCPFHSPAHDQVQALGTGHLRL
jgi:hypothetical protein